MELTLAQELLLLAYDDETGKAVIDSTVLRTALAGATVSELILDGHLVVGADDKLARTGSAPSDEMLADIVEFVDGRKPKAAVEGLSVWSWRDRSGKLRDHLLAQLAERGVLTAERRKVLGLLPTTRWVESDGGAEAPIRQRLRDVLLADGQPDERTGTLIAVASAAGLVKKLYADKDERKCADERAKEIREGDWAGSAVKSAIDSLITVMVMVMAVPIVTSSSN